MSDLYAQPTRRRTHVRCVQTDCGGRYAEIKINRSDKDMVLATYEVGGDVVGYRVIRVGEFYLEMLSGFMAADADGIWRASQKRLAYWRWQLKGVQPRTRFARGDERAILTVDELPAHVECDNPQCLRVQVMDAGVLGLVQGM